MHHKLGNFIRVAFTWLLGRNHKPQNIQLAIWQQLSSGLEEIKTPSVIGGNNDTSSIPPVIDIQTLQTPNSFSPYPTNGLDACPADHTFDYSGDSLPLLRTPIIQNVNTNNNLSNLINSDKPSFIIPFDPPGVNKNDVIFIKNPINNLILGSNSLTHQINLDQVFDSKNKQILNYQIVSVDSKAISVNLQENKLNISSTGKSGLTNITIRAKDKDSNSLNQIFSVINSELNPQSETVKNLNSAFNKLNDLFNENQDLVTALDTEEADAVLDKIMDILDENPDLLKFITQPESLAILGINSTGIETVKKLLQSPKIAEEFGLNITLGEVLSNRDSDKLDKWMVNGENAIEILPSNAKQPQVAFIDFTQGQHGEKVVAAATNINPFLNEAKQLKVTNGNWAEQLVKFVNFVIKSGENNGIANLSFDLSQLDEIGDTTRYELTPAEQIAIQYAQDNNIVLVVAAGNTGDKMSALGAASKQFDNIITVGSVNQLQQKTDYSSYGDELTLVAPGGEWNNNPKAFVGTSKSTAYVTAAASLAWAANPDLSYQQIKQILIDTTQDLDTPGWDIKTGAGLINIKEAINRAQLIEPQIVDSTVNPEIKSFSGEGRVWTLARPASPETENAISGLKDIQENLFNQLQNLADLDNPNLTIAELKAQLENQLNLKLDNYQEIIAQAAISTAKYEQLKTALDLAFQNRQIEYNQLETLQKREQELQTQLIAFQGQKSDLEAATQKQLNDIQKQITELAAKLAKSEAKLSNPFANADDNLQTDSQPLQKAADEQNKLAKTLGENASDLAQLQQKYINLANGINPQRWQVVGYESRISGRNREIWGWGQNPQLVKQKNQYIWQADIGGKNSQYLQQLAQQAEKQAIDLNNYAQFLEDRKNNLDIGEASVEDAGKILEFLEKQQEQQAEIAKQYWQEVSIAEARGSQSQNIANYHNSQINQWQIVGTKSGRSGRGKTDVWGTVYYPEHIAPRDQAQQQANSAEKQRKEYEVLARQAQQQADFLQTQVEKLKTRIKDWPVLKQGIDYEIIANQQHLQAEKDLLVENTVIQKQKLETVNLQINQLATELNNLTNKTLPQQQQVTTEIENRFQNIQSELQAVQEDKTTVNNNFQNFLELEGFILPTRERLAILDHKIQQLENEKLEIIQNLDNLNQQILQNPNNQVLQPLVDIWSNRLTQLEQELDWVKIQKQELAMTVGDSPERLAISQLINELEKSETPASLKSKVTNLQEMESGGGSFLAGFDNLESRFNDAKTEQNRTHQSLNNLQDEYLNLGLNKADIEHNQIPHKQNEIVGKEKEIVQTQNSISQSETKLDNLQKQLPLLQNNVDQKSAEINQKDQEIQQTQTEITNIQNQITDKNTEIQQNQIILQDYQNQINQANAKVQQLEQQRQTHQNAANYWNSQIYTWGIVGWERKRKGGDQPIYGWVYNPGAVNNRNAEQNAANVAAQQRDITSQQAQLLTASLQPKITETQTEIEALQQDKQVLNQELQSLQNQLTTEKSELQQLKQELATLNQQLNILQSKISQEQQNLANLNNTLNTQQEERVNLLAALDNLNQQKTELAQQLIDKYREIELTEQYLQQVNNEVTRLQSRLELFNQADALEQNYQNNWQDLQTDIKRQNDLTQALLNTRQLGEPIRQNLTSLQQHLNDAKSNLEKVQTLEKKLTDFKQAVVLTEIQKENQRLLKQSLDDSDAALASQQTYYYNLALSYSQKMWYWNGKEYAYNSAEAQAYLQYLQQASFIADQRNQRWEQSKQAETKIKELDEKLTQQKSDITKAETDLAALESATTIKDTIITLQSSIDEVNEQLKPLIDQENQQIQELKQTVNIANKGISDLQQTIELQSTSLSQLISLGALASESDVDFFDTQIQPKVNQFTEQLQQRNEELSQQQSNLNQLIDSWKQQLNNVEDATSKQYLTNLINQSQSQLNNLGNLKFGNQAVITKLEEKLNQAVAALETLRQKQELEIRQKTESNNTRLESLLSQLNSEKAAEFIKDNETVLAYAQLADQIKNDARNGVKNWTWQYQSGYLMTKNADESMQNLSQSVDELIADITNNLPAPLGKYKRSETTLENGINTLGVVIPRADGYEQNVIDTEQEIEKIKQRILQDAQLWEEIAPLAIRYGLESEQLKEFLSQNYPQKIAEAKQKANEFEQQRQQYQANADMWNSKINSNGLGFDANYYLSKNPDVAAAVARGGIASAWEHFIRWGQYEGRNPSASFDNAYYLSKNPDVAAAVARGGFRSGVQHFVQYGQYENRAHNPIAEANKNAAQTAANNAAQQRDSLLQQAVDLEDYRKNFLSQHPENATVIDLFQQEILEGSSSNSQISQQLNATRADDLLNANSLEGLNPLQQLFNKAKATQADLQAKGIANLTQADWYQNQAAYHWSVSRKNGPYWWEEVCTRGRSGKKSCQWVQHVDQNWILWNQYSKLFPQLRQQGQDYLTEADKWRKEKERLEPLVNQWSDANNAANEAEPTIREAQDIFAQLEVEREKIPQFKTQLEILENLLPTLREQLAESQQKAQKTRATVTQDWTEYDVNSEEYQQVLADILQHRGEVNRQAIETQAKLADSERWVENQSVALSTELSQSQALYSQLNTQRNNLNQQILNLENQGGNDLQITELKSKLAQLDQSLPLLENKITILTSQQTAFTHKRTLLTAQNEVIRVEQKLLDAYIKDPFADNSNIEQELLDARAALAEAQRLAEQAEKDSQALTAPLQELKTDLLAQNDEHLQAAKAQQKILKELIDKSQLTANLTLQIAQSNGKLNDLKTQAIIRLQQATDAGFKEAKALLDVAKYNDMATVAEIYYRDYSDLASDKGGKCTAGFARPEDRILADQYYTEMLNQRELQRQSQQQANDFGNIRKTAEAQLQTLQEQQNEIAKSIEELNNKLVTTQEEKAAKEQELAVAQIRLAEISKIRDVTEQTFTNLVNLEQLNLAQAQLEMEMAEKLQNNIEQTVKERMERDRLELEHQRLETTAKIAQLQQLMNEDSLRQSLNEIRANLGIETLDETENSANLQTQLAQLLTNLQNLQTEQSDSLDDNLKALLAETMGDIHLALQGKEASTIQDSLLQAMSGLIEKIQPYKEQINQIDLDEQLDYQLFQTAQQDLPGASQQLLKELERNKALGVEEEIINPLYIEALTKVAYAEQAVDISNDLAAQGKEMLEQIIKQRIVERKVRKKAFWNKILGIIQNVIGVVGLILSFTPLAPFGWALTAASAGIAAVQSIVNGDWIGGIFQAVMAGLGAVTGGLTNVLGASATAVRVMQTLQSLATGAFNGVRSAMSGDSIMGFLQTLGSVAGAASGWMNNLMSGLSQQAQNMMKSIVNTLQQAPLLIYGGIQAIKNGDWLTAINNIFNAALTIGKNFAGNFNQALSDILKQVGKVGNTALTVAGMIEQGGIGNWLSGLENILSMWMPDILNLVDRLRGEPIDPNLSNGGDDYTTSC